MRTLYSGRVFAEYSQFYVTSDPVLGPDLDATFAGQTNGICGAAVQGFLLFLTGTHYGPIEVTVEIDGARPELDDTWEEIVEVSFTPASEEVHVVSWRPDGPPPFVLERGDYRVRCSVSGMAEAVSADFDPDRPVERCLLQLWPAPPAPDRVLEQTSVVAARNHERARQIPPPPPPPTPEELAELERQRQVEEENERLRLLARDWGGRLPTERLLAVGGAAQTLCGLDLELVHALDGADPALQRVVARWAVHRVYDRAGLSGVDWIVPALAALDRGDPLPPPFDQPDHAWQRLYADPLVPHTTITSMDGRSRNCHQQSFALPALRAAAHADPLRAVLDATFDAIAGYGIDYPELLAELRLAFPRLFGRS
jgi:hypothetical protein